ncbi:hypothetical protein EV421DRAFT_1272301 [Armillaria borealis]|uniref:Uncharacterized protein n=1 Tax=Armillaria borealis TaxID=47425 RepID=A0AA39J2M8_9AGAR|nr:hypothetical protein EV421DRAFT_1272301 [Armillaria borealis]
MPLAILRGRVYRPTRCAPNLDKISRIAHSVSPHALKQTSNPLDYGASSEESPRLYSTYWHPAVSGSTGEYDRLSAPSARPAQIGSHRRSVGYAISCRKSRSIEAPSSRTLNHENQEAGTRYTGPTKYGDQFASQMVCKGATKAFQRPSPLGLRTESTREDKVRCVGLHSIYIWRHARVNKTSNATTFNGVRL